VFKQSEWLNEPSTWSLDGETLNVTTDPNTDFWRKTHYGFTRDSGHCFGVRMKDDFTAQVHVRGQFHALYDQAGLMVRIDESTWIKAGVEFTDGVLMMSSVLTVGRSDWAIGSAIAPTDGFWLRVTVTHGVLRVQYSVDGKTWPLLRLAPFPSAPRYFVGPICCTPERGGLNVAFSRFTAGAPLQKDLHDLS
jgi:uncharacterized protein